MNKLVVFNSIVALILIILSFTVDWLFLIGAVILMIVNQKILIKNKK
ncbi:MAG: hypothetical protein KKB62_03195 [Nanoarchaeota archaeon]|nr:hypothetical protein [Nanoarchaeota archaeon]